MTQVFQFKLDVGAPLPASIGRCADYYHEVRALRLLMEKEAEAVKARETELREHIIANLSKSQDTGAAGLRYRAQIVTKVKAKIADWAMFTNYVVKRGRFDLLQKRLSDTAVAETWEAGEVIDGLEKINVPDVSITKI